MKQKGLRTQNVTANLYAPWAQEYVIDGSKPLNHKKAVTRPCHLTLDVANFVAPGSICPIFIDNGE